MTPKTSTTKHMPRPPVRQQCYLCDGKKLSVIRTKLRHDIRRNVLKCALCGLTFLQPKGNVVSYYRKAYRQKHGPILGKTLSSRELFEFNMPLQAPRIASLDHLLKPKTKVLDIGSSTGHFLYAIKDRVAEVVGIELNLANAEFTRKELGITVYNDPIEKTDLPVEYFDLITVYHTFEHVEDPLTFLQFVYRYLKPGGHLFIEVPNTEDALMSVYGLESFADFWFIEPHIFYYTIATLKKMLAKAGFRGDLHTTQSFSFINHVNWMLTGKPQGDWITGTATPTLVTDPRIRPAVRNELNRWMKKMDREYRQILNKHQVGGNIVFLGQKTAHHRKS